MLYLGFVIGEFPRRDVGNHLDSRREGKVHFCELSADDVDGGFENGGVEGGCDIEFYGSWIVAEEFT